MVNFRIGHGYDVHKLVRDRDLILGGVKIPFEKGLFGHSDADVLFHAVIDAVIGAIGLGDIGVHFPDTDERYKGISGAGLAKEIVFLMEENGFAIGNIDATVICQEPKLSPYIPEMKKNISSAFCTSESNVNIKATTEEHLGFTGRGEGISAHAVCILEKKEELK